MRLTARERTALITLGLLVILRAMPAGAQAERLPDPALTPGAIDPAATDLCQPGAATDARGVSDATESEVKRRYGVGGVRAMWPVSWVPMARHTYSIDHLIPTCLGGDSSLVNLWPAPNQGRWSRKQKDRLDRTICGFVCGGRVNREEAQSAIALNWIAAYLKWVDGPPPPASPESRDAAWGHGPGHSDHGHGGHVKESDIIKPATPVTKPTRQPVKRERIGGDE